MYSIRETSAFKKSFKRFKFNKKVIEEVKSVVFSLAKGEKVHASYRDHALKGNYIGYRECHIQPDVLLIYKIENEVLILTLAYLGSHSDLF